MRQFLIIIIFIASYLSAKAQDESCLIKISEYREFLQIKLYEYAREPWKVAFKDCPTARKGIYTEGIKIYQGLIGKTDNPEILKGYVDTLVLIYEQRIEHFGQEGFVNGLIGIDMLKYRKNEPDIAAKYFEKSYEVDGVKSNPSILYSYGIALQGLIKTQGVDSLKILNEFMAVLQTSKKQTEAASDEKQKKAAQKTVDYFTRMLLRDTIFQCHTILKYFEQQNVKTLTNIAELEFVIEILESNSCSRNKLYFDLLLQKQKLQPDDKTSFQLYSYYQSNENYTEAEKHLNNAISQQHTDIVRAGYFIEMAKLKMKREQLPEVRNYAQKSIKLGYYLGEAYILIGLAYASSSEICQDKNTGNKAVFWLAVDMFEKAKKLDPKLTNKADELIRVYSKYFPDTEDTFMLGIGEIYHVGCWINEDTKVRGRGEE